MVRWGCCGPLGYNDAVTPKPLLPTAQAFGPAPPGGDPLLDELADVAREAAGRAAAVLVAGLEDGPRQVQTKSSATDMVSAVDRDAEAAVAEVVARRRPDDALLGEEGGSREGTTGVRWVVDPLDGTTNYLFGVPHYSVSVAAEIDGVGVVGVVHDPSRHETWAAVADRPARRNGRPWQLASDRSTVDTALVSTGFGYSAARRAWQGQVAARVLPQVRDLRRFGSAALDLCWVAGGRVDAYYEWGLHAWDFSAGRVICTQAGATVEIVADRLIVACAPALRGPLLGLLDRCGASSPPPDDDNH